MGGISLRFARVEGERVIPVYVGGKFGGLGTELRTHAVPDAWKARTGPYEVLNQDPEPFVERFALEYDARRDLLFCVVKVRTLADELRYVVDPIAEDTLAVAGKGRHLGETMKIVPVNGGEALSYSGLLLGRTPSGLTRNAGLPRLSPPPRAARG